MDISTSVFESLLEDSGLISSIYLSDITGVKHKNITELIEKYKSDLFYLGYDKYEKPLKGKILDDFLKRVVKSEIKTSKYGSSKSYMLTVSQAKNVLVLMGNSNNTITQYKHDIACNKLDENIFKMRGRGFVYMISNMKGLYKIGRTINPKQRIRAIETQMGAKVELIQISDYIFEYEELENELHQLCKDKLVMGEWYKLTDTYTVELRKPEEMFYDEYNYNPDDLSAIACHIENNGATITEFDKIKLNYHIDYNTSKQMFKEINA